ncbi:MAG: hypothetical protein RSD76_01275 [Clostridia bacterium]
MNWIMGMSEAVTATVAPVAPATVNSLVALPLFTKGLITTVIGLLGVFMVLALFFVTIKLMQKIKTKGDA